MYRVARDVPRPPTTEDYYEKRKSNGDAMGVRGLSALTELAHCLLHMCSFEFGKSFVSCSDGTT